MKQVKVRKIGNSIGIILPKTSGLKEGDILSYSEEDDRFILESSLSKKRHDMLMIEESFEDFEKGLTLSEEDMKLKYGKYGWGSSDV